MKPQQIIDHIDHTKDKRAALPTEQEEGNEKQDYPNGKYQEEINRSIRHLCKLKPNLKLVYLYKMRTSEKRT
jgi:hypothetical protein